MDTIDFKDFSSSDDKTIEDIIGVDIFGLLDAQNEEFQQEEEEQQEEHIVKFKYSEKKKRRLIDAFMTSYVNDYGRNDPYHIDNENSFIEKVKSKIHAIYGNRSIVQYIYAMRDVFKVYEEMYQQSSSRLVISFPEYIEMIVAGDIAAPFNHPLIRTNVPQEIIMRYILNDKLDPEEIKQYTSSGQRDEQGGFIFDFTNVEKDFNTPIEYEVLPEKYQVRMLQSWLSGKPKTSGLDKNESNLVYGITSIYDKADITDPSTFKFDEPISHHEDILSWKNIKRNQPTMIHLKNYTMKSLEESRKGQFIRDIMRADADNLIPNYLTMRGIFERMETHAAERNQPITTFRMLNRMNLYAQGVQSVKINKYGREVYKYRDKTKVKVNSTKQMIRDIERKAEVFKDLTDSFYNRLHSPNFQSLIEEIQNEQAMISKYGLSYYTEGE